MEDNFNKTRIVKNSTLLYIRMLFTMWLNLYATRLVLKNLGIEDMGTYGVIGSIVSLFSVFTIGITNTVQRFITFELGKENGNVNKVFCSSLNVIILLSIFILILFESVGIWILYHWVNIPESSLHAAYWVYQLSILGCLVSLISIPYNALIVAYEKMDAFAVISIIQVILSCVAAYSISFAKSDRLVIYAILMATINVLIRIAYQLYCRFNLEVSKFRLIVDSITIKEMSRFAGVSTISGILYLIYSQGLVFVINWTFGVALNAVYSIAMQLKNSILSFAYNIYRAMSPQITKTYASGEIEMHKNLVYSACKLQIYMLYFILIPFIFRTKYILTLWLGTIPQYTVAYAKVIICLCIIYALVEPIRTAVNASGRIMKFTLIADFFCIITLPITYLLTHESNAPIVFIICVVFFDTTAWGIRIYYALNVTSLNLVELCKRVIIPAFKVAIGGLAVCSMLALYLQESILGLLLMIAINSLILIGIIYAVGINSTERKLINKIAQKTFKHNE